MIAGQALFHRTYDRDSSRHRGLIQKISAVHFRRFQQLLSFGSDDIFVGSHHALSGIQCLQHIRKRRLNPSHHFNDNLDLRVVQNLLNVIGQNGRIVHLLRCLL